MKKKLAYIALLSMLTLAACSSKKEPEAASTAPEILETDTIDTKTQKYVQSYIDQHYKKTTLDRISINEDLGTAATGDYVAMVYLTWDVKNNGKNTHDMLKMHSTDMSVRVQVDLPEIQELVIFWSIPYLNSDAKISYVRTEKGMQLSDDYYGFSY